MTFDTIDAALEALMQRRSNGLPGLEQLKQCLSELGNPHLKLKSFHIGGTNGKGSTTNYLRSMLQESGYRVGSFSSPHLVSHHDRFRIDNQPISDDDLLYWINQTTPYWGKYGFSMFVIDMLVAILYFLDQEVDVALFEVGLGGRLDATNVIIPLASIITNIGYDHMEQLGDTLALIAAEKAGIIKDHVPLYTCENKPECLDVFAAKAKEHQAPLTRVFFPRNAQIKDHHLFFTTRHIEVELSTIALYQVANASLALAVLLDYRQEFPLISEDSLRRGLKQAVWPGRFEIMGEHPLIIIDGAHNAEGIEALIQNFKNIPRPITVIYSALKDKPYHTMLKALIQVADHVIVSEFEMYRKATADELANGFQVTVEPDYQQAIETAIRNNPEGTIVITGSLYFISDVRAYLNQQG